MSICLVWERADGGITVEYPAYGDTARPSSDTDAALIARCIAKTRPRLEAKYSGACTYHEIDSSALPSDSYFRNAWEWSD